MITAKCIEKLRDANGCLCGYRLMDNQGRTKDVAVDQLKKAIHNGQISVTNLRLTPDNRLMVIGDGLSGKPEKSLTDIADF